MSNVVPDPDPTNGVSGKGTLSHGTTGADSGESLTTSYHKDAEYPPADHGPRAWIFLAGSFWLEGFLWGRLGNVTPECCDALLKGCRIQHSPSRTVSLRSTIPNIRHSKATRALRQSELLQWSVLNSSQLAHQTEREKRLIEQTGNGIFSVTLSSRPTTAMACSQKSRVYHRRHLHHRGPVGSIFRNNGHASDLHSGIPVWTGFRHGIQSIHILPGRLVHQTERICIRRFLVGNRFLWCHHAVGHGMGIERVRISYHTASLGSDYSKNASCSLGPPNGGKAPMRARTSGLIEPTSDNFSSAWD